MSEQEKPFKHREGMEFKDDEIASDLPPLAEKSPKNSALTVLVAIFLLLIGIAGIAFLMVVMARIKIKKKKQKR